MRLPKVRTTDVLEQEAGSELLIYDLAINKAYILNETSKIVYLACNGATTFEDLRRRYHYTDELIHLAIAELAAGNLIESYESVHFEGLSRRAVIRQVGLATAAVLPVIAVISAPSATSAASLTPCQRNNCTDGAVGGGPGCNPPGGCSSTFNGRGVCCALNGRCGCTEPFSCQGPNTQICPAIA